jgi:hypothetical protein
VWIGTVFFGKKLSDEEIPDVPFADAVSPAEAAPEWLLHWKPWLAATVAIILIAYGPMLFEAVRTAELFRPALLCGNMW